MRVADEVRETELAVLQSRSRRLRWGRRRSSMECSVVYQVDADNILK